MTRDLGEHWCPDCGPIGTCQCEKRKRKHMTIDTSTIRIPPEVVEPTAKAICDAELWPGMWDTLDKDSNECAVYRKMARAAIAAGLAAWPKVYTVPIGYPATDIVLPLPPQEDQSDD